MNDRARIDVVSNYIKVLENIDYAASRSGRDVKDIKVVGVTKRIEFERIKLVLDAGLSIIGEVMGTEFKHKFPLIKSYRPNIILHVIGNMQRNKVKLALDTCDLIQSVRSEIILAEINKRAARQARVYPIFLQVDFSAVSNRKGLTLNEVIHFLKLIETKYTNVVVKGFMTIAPLEYENNETILRKFFSKTYSTVFDTLATFLDSPKDEIELSMGMSSDYTIAIEEGATMVRIGTAIFGPRN